MSRVEVIISDKDSNKSTVTSFDCEGMDKEEVLAKVDELINETGYRKVIVQVEAQNLNDEMIELLDLEDITLY